MGSDTVSRRGALKSLAAGAAGVAASSLWVEALAAVSRQQAHAHGAQAVAAQPAWTPKVLDPKQNELVATLVDLIIPATDTPGAREAGVNRFVDLVLQEAPPSERQQFLKGLAWIDARSAALFQKPFVAALATEQTALLTRLSAEGNPDKEEPAGRQFFEAIKSMTIDGYYTTEIGLRRELGDSGQLFLPAFPACDHPEHQ
jgi:hypothetical protein